ncbi:YceD family protein [Arthrobacter sp. 7Tela_A1]|uniref:YceD family protein n=1 Tax=Arthrobacter sp. 7Tela_A1 TaxID=3093745 RepID=UPI003BB53ABF
MAVNVKDLGRSPGTMRTMHEHVPAPKDFGVALIGVPDGSDLELDLRFEAVHEGILVSGTAVVPVRGECGRCLTPIAYDQDVDVQELFYYEDAESFGEEEEEEQRRIERDVIDLEPVLRDAVVISLPFQPVCREDCEGLCPECGVRLEEDPGHHHEVVDPRWAALAGLTGTAADNEAAKSTESDEREES